MMQARSSFEPARQLSPEVLAAITAEVWLDGRLQFEIQKNPTSALKNIATRFGVEPGAISLDAIASSPMPALFIYPPDYDDTRPPISSALCGTYDLSCGAACSMDCSSAFCESHGCTQSFDTVCPNTTYCTSSRGCPV